MNDTRCLVFENMYENYRNTCLYTLKVCAGTNVEM